jgi:hypothetical protein
MLVLSSCIHVRLLCDCLAHVYYVRLSRTRILCAIVSHTYICDPIASTHVSHSALLFHLLGSRLFATITCGDIAHVYRRSDRETIACVNDQCTFRAVYVRCYRTQLSLSLSLSLYISFSIPRHSCAMLSHTHVHSRPQTHHAHGQKTKASPPLCYNNRLEHAGPHTPLQFRVGAMPEHTLEITPGTEAWEWHERGFLRWVVNCFTSWKLYIEVLGFEKQAIENGHEPDVACFALGITNVDGNMVHVLSVNPLLGNPSALRQDDPPRDRRVESRLRAGTRAAARTRS